MQTSCLCLSRATHLLTCIAPSILNPAAPGLPCPRHPQLQMAGMAPYTMPYAGNGGMHSNLAFFGAGTSH